MCAHVIDLQQTRSAPIDILSRQAAVLRNPNWKQHIPGMMYKLRHMWYIHEIINTVFFYF